MLLEPGGRRDPRTGFRTGVILRELVIRQSLLDALGDLLPGVGKEIGGLV